MDRHGGQPELASVSLSMKCPGYMPPNSIGAIPSSFPGASKILAKVTESETVLICDPPLTSYASSPSSSSVCIQKIRLQIRQTPAPQTVFCESLVLRGYSAEITQAWETLYPTLSKVHSAHQHVLQETTCSSQLSYVVPTVFGMEVLLPPCCPYDLLVVFSRKYSEKHWVFTISLG